VNGEPDVRALRELYRRGGGTAPSAPASASTPSAPATLAALLERANWRPVWFAAASGFALLAGLWAAGFPGS
jgi:hypothetical protein